MEKSRVFTIAEIERETGIGKDTLRVWERRYGFPCPGRTPHGERAYPADQLDRLRLAKRLLDKGLRPARVVPLEADALAALLADTPSAEPTPPHGETDPDAVGAFLDLIRMHQPERVKGALQQMVMRQGLRSFVMDTLPVLNHAVGNEWLQGKLTIPDEHLYTEQVQNVLRAALANLSPDKEKGPRVLLTTFPDELHTLGLLMAETLLVSGDAQCVSLGTQTPLEDIGNSVERGGFDIVALSFSAAFPRRRAMEGLRALRDRLPQHVELWAGGGGISHRPQDLPNIRVISRIGDTLAALAAWRDNHPERPTP